METPEKILADILGTTEEYISKNAQSNPPYEGEYFPYIEAMKKYADMKVKNLVKPDVSSSFCDCISTIGVDGERYGKWTCRSCKKEVPNKNRKY